MMDEDYNMIDEDYKTKHNGLLVMRRQGGWLQHIDLGRHISVSQVYELGFFQRMLGQVCCTFT